MAGIIQEQLSLAEISHREVERYVGYSDQSTMYFLSDDDHQVYTVIDIPHIPRSYSTEIVVMARVVGDYIVIDEDTTDKLLVEALIINAGLPREKIILAYQGELIPTSAS
ncbi:MAG: XisI protein [Anaerolineae bacterium]|nr:XisI protein [Anaerolineae bacterium]